MEVKVLFICVRIEQEYSVMYTLETDANINTICLDHV